MSDSTVQPLATGNISGCCKGHTTKIIPPMGSGKVESTAGLVYRALAKVRRWEDEDEADVVPLVLALVERLVELENGKGS